MFGKKKKIKKVKRKFLMFGEPQLSHTFNSYEAYLEYKNNTK